MLSLGDVDVTIAGFPILRDLCLDVPPGHLVGLVGRNGAGKTTTLKAIMGVVAVREGRIRFGDLDLRRVAAHRRAALGIGYMPEDRRLIGVLTVEDNVMLPLWAHRRADSANRLAYAYDLIPELRPMARRRASSLSGGQQKLVALARAVAIGTRLLLLDEPFEGLSLAAGERLAGTIGELHRRGVTILVAESDPRRIVFADPCLTIERGHIMTGSRTPVAS